MAREPSTARVRPRRRVADPDVVAGAFLTDGKRLLEVRRLNGEVVIVEEGPTDAPTIGSVWLADVTSGEGWRVVKYDPFDVDQWWKEFSRG